MRRVRVVIHPSKERGSRILAHMLQQKMASAGMFVQEIRDIVDEPRDHDEWAFQSLCLDCGCRAHRSMAVMGKCRGARGDLQESQEMTASSLGSRGHSRSLCVSRRRLSSIVNWPLRISFDGKTYHPHAMISNTISKGRKAMYRP